MNEFISACIEANRELYDYINTKLVQNDLKYDGSVGHGGDKSSNIDLKAEAIFVKHLLKFGDIYSEESGWIKSQSLSHSVSQSLITIDPLDGSDNFLSHLPYYGTSVAFEREGEIKAAVVCNLASADIVIKDEIGVRYSSLISKEEKEVFQNSDPKIAIFERAYKFPHLCKEIEALSIKWRSPGAVALSLANARDYRFVLFAGSMREFDLKAALYICDDLYIYQSGTSLKNDEFLLVSKNREDFRKIKEIINKL